MDYPKWFWLSDRDNFRYNLAFSGVFRCRYQSIMSRNYLPSFLLCLLITLQLSGQEKVKPFLPDFFAAYPQVRDLAMDADHREMYFTIESPLKEFSVIVVSRALNGVWQAPQVAPFSGQYHDLEPFLAPDGLHLYFASDRPMTGHETNDMNIWFVSRSSWNDRWGDPRPVNAPIHTDKDEFYPSVAANGNLYFTRLADDPQQKEDIFISQAGHGGYQDPEPLPAAINGKTYEFNASIAADESFILFTSYGREDDLGGSDLYISRKGDQGQWLPAEHLAGINSNRIDYCPFVDLERHILYFTSERSDIPRRYDQPQSLQELLNQFHQPAHGAGRIYFTEFRP